MKAPDPIPAPVMLTQREALATLAMISKTHPGMGVAVIGYWPDAPPHPQECGYAVLPTDERLGRFSVRQGHRPTWVWSNRDNTLAWRPVSALGSVMIPLAIVPETVLARVLAATV